MQALGERVQDFDEVFDLSESDVSDWFGHRLSLNSKLYVDFADCTCYFDEDSCVMSVESGMLRQSEIGYLVFKRFENAGIRAGIDYKRMAFRDTDFYTRFRFRDHEIMTMARLAM